MFKQANELLIASFVAVNQHRIMKKRLRAFRFAMVGLQTFFRETFHAKIHTVAAFFAITAGFWFRLSLQEWMWLIACIFCVFITEILNSAIEYVVDLTSPEAHPLAKKAKDVAAAAVLLAAIFSAIIALIIFSMKFDSP